MYEINLLNKIDPLVSPPPKWKITLCGCGNHPVNPKRDIYKQHNKWMAQQEYNIEKGSSKMTNIKGVGHSAPNKPKPSYDLSGDEYELSAEQLRKFNDKRKE